MGRNEWYRRVTWTEDDKEEFMTRLSRARSDFNKAQYLRIQASYLHQHAVPPLYQESIELLDKLLEEYPNSEEAAGALLQKAQCFESLDKIEEATELYIRAVEVDRKTKGIKTRAPLEFARFATKHELSSHYKKVTKALASSKRLLLFPEGQYLAAAAMAIISEGRGKKRKARKYAKQALKASEVSDSGLDGRPDIGLVKEPDEEIIAKLRKIIGA